jgi:hypothetical protein
MGPGGRSPREIGDSGYWIRSEWGSRGQRSAAAPANAHCLVSNRTDPHPSIVADALSWPYSQYLPGAALVSY